MSEFAKVGTETPEERNTLSVLWVITAAILCGIGMFLVTGALIRLAGGLVNWVWWIGILPGYGGVPHAVAPPRRLPRAPLNGPLSSAPSVIGRGRLSRDHARGGARRCKARGQRPHSKERGGAAASEDPASTRGGAGATGGTFRSFSSMGRDRSDTLERPAGTSPMHPRTLRTGRTDPGGRPS